MGKSTWLRVVLLGVSVVGWLIALSGCLPDTASPDFVLGFNPTEVTVTTGSAATTVVSVNRTGGFASPVELLFLGIPTGVSLAFDPNPVSGSRSTLTVTAAASVIPGIYTLVLRGAGDGLVRTAHLTLNVVAAGPSGTVLFFDDFADNRQNPAWSFNTREWYATTGRYCTLSYDGASTGFVATGRSWGPYAIAFDLWLGNGTQVGVVFYAQQDLKSTVIIWGTQDEIWLQVLSDGVEVRRSASASPGFFVGYQTVRVESDGTTYNVFVKDLLRATFRDSTYRTGMPGIANSDRYGSICIDNYKVTARQ